MKHKVSTLTGTLLDAAVQIAEFGPPDPRLIYGEGGEPPVGVVTFASHPVDVLQKLAPDFDPVRAAQLRAICDEPWSPSTNWRDGGQIIERERIGFDWIETEWTAWINSDDSTVDECLRSLASIQSGPTPLIAAMRAYVASKLGDEVELP